MSTTMPSASRVARWKVASTTYVAPCSRCAGPNTSPRKLWAIIMWSRTVTLNKAHSPETSTLRSSFGRGLIVDAVTQRGKLVIGQPGKHLGQLLEVGFAG